MIKNRYVLLLVVIIILSSGCGVIQPATPTSSPLPPTATPTYTATSTSTSTPTTTPVPSGPCDNPLVPLVSGTSYEYQVTTSSGPSLFTLNIGDRKDMGNINIEVQVIDHKHEWDIQELVICDDGMIVNFPLYVMSMLMVDHLQGILNTYHYYETGPYAPSYATLSSNDWVYSWEPGYLLEENVMLTNPMGGSNLFLSGMSDIDVKFVLDGNWQPVEVPAGIYPTSLETKVDYHMVATIIEESSGCSVVLHTTQWYVPYLGLVCARIDNAELKISGQLFPMGMDSTLELVKYTPGP